LYWSLIKNIQPSLYTNACRYKEHLSFALPCDAFAKHSKGQMPKMKRKLYNLLAKDHPLKVLVKACPTGKTGKGKGKGTGKGKGKGIKKDVAILKRTTSPMNLKPKPKAKLAPKPKATTDQPTPQPKATTDQPTPQPKATPEKPKAKMKATPEKPKAKMKATPEKPEAKPKAKQKKDFSKPSFI
jgi:hypothetical protein